MKKYLTVACYFGLVFAALPAVLVAQEEGAAEVAQEAEAGAEAQAEDAGRVQPEEQKPLLTVGSTAPVLDVEHWVQDGQGKFKPVTDFKKDHVYIVEFWATWCGPCIASMPHISKLQDEYADKNVQVVSISDEPLKTVEGFLEGPVRGEEDMTYAELTKNYCLTTDPDESVYEDYMRAAGQNGIPTAFIVGKQGKVEWIGHPMEMDEPLAAVVSGDWDRDAFAAEFTAQQKAEAMMEGIYMRLQRGDTAKALELIDAAVAELKTDQQKDPLLGMKLQVQLSEIMEAGKNDEALALLDKTIETSKSEMIVQMAKSMRSRLVIMIGGSVATQALTDALKTMKGDSLGLNELAWSVVEMAQTGKKQDAEVLQAAAKVAKAAVAADPESGAVLDTLANVVYLQGDLDQAIELQTKALELSGDMPEIQSFLRKLKMEKKKLEESEKSQDADK